LETKVNSLGQIYKNSNPAPDKTAILFKDSVVTYKELDDNVIAYANYFKSIGVKPTDKVILDMGNTPEFTYSYLGVVRNAAVIVPVNPMLTLPELSYIAENSDAKFMLIQEGVLLKHEFTVNALESELNLKVIVFNEDFKKAVENAPREDYDLVDDPSQLSTFLYTSGTTGKPKAAMLSHGNLLQNSAQTHVGLGMRNDDITMCVLPMFHVFAFTLCVLMPAFGGGTSNVVETFSPKEVIDNLLEKDVTVFMGVPAMYIVLIEAGKKNIVFPKLRMATSGGAALPVEVYKQARDLINLTILEGYGLTEASPGVACNPPSIQKPGSIGLKLPDIEFIIGDDNDKELPIGEVGELLLRGPNIMQGYYKLPEATEETLKNGWLHTGDLAKVDEDGYIFIVDRKKDLIIVAGLNVYPREVEEVLYTHPKVKEAAVIGEVDSLRGETVIAYVALKDGEEEIHHKEILRWLKTKLAAYKIPRRIYVIDEIPKNASGKILKRLLKEDKPE
jgi:long-chain acyl-CoA synthetase